MNERDKGAREKRLRRLAGASAEAKKAMAEGNKNAIWTARCRVCGAKLEGTSAQLAEHRHDVAG